MISLGQLGSSRVKWGSSGVKWGQVGSRGALGPKRVKWGHVILSRFEGIVGNMVRGLVFGLVNDWVIGWESESASLTNLATANLDNTAI